MAATTWSTTDKSANMTLSGGNLIATAAGALVSVRAVHPKRTGKYYIEYLSTTTQGTNGDFGFGTSKTPIGATPFLQSFVIQQNGSNFAYDSFGIQITGLGSQGVSVTTGTLLCFAIDLDAGQIWVRMSAAGNWNNNAANNPATGVGGISLSGTGLGQGIDVYPIIFLGLTANSITANFGGSAFTGAVPSGFTSGWDDSVAIVTNVVSTQISLDQWANNPSPDMQATQILIEQWAEVNTSNPQFILTQTALEQWASVAEAASASQARAWVMA